MPNDLENHMVIGPYYPDPPRPERDPDAELDAYQEQHTWKEAGVRVCHKCQKVARLFDGAHEDCTVKKEVQSVTDYAIIKGAHNG